MIDAKLQQLEKASGRSEDDVKYVQGLNSSLYYCVAGQILDDLLTKLIDKSGTSFDDTSNPRIQSRKRTEIFVASMTARSHAILAFNIKAPGLWTPKPGPDKSPDAVRPMSR